MGSCLAQELYGLGGKLTHLSEPCCVTRWGWDDTDSTTLSSECSFHASVQASLMQGWRLGESVGTMEKPQMGSTKDPTILHHTSATSFSALVL